jgi:selenocysteine-specific elongation factor
MPREELRSRLGLAPQLFNALVVECVERNMIAVEGNLLRTSGHELRFSVEQKEKVDRFLREMIQTGANTPSVKESQRRLGEALYLALLDTGRLRQLNAEVVYESEQFKDLKSRIIEHIRRNEQIDAAQTRDLLQTSRKYAIAILEHLDDIKVTKRVGDARVLY